MALDFPNNPPPQTGDAYTGDNGVTYTYDGVKWIGVSIEAGSGLPVASTTTAGVVKVDGTTITIADGVISSVGGGNANTGDITFDHSTIIGGTNGNVVISTNYNTSTNNFLFDSTGNLTLPNALQVNNYIEVGADHNNGVFIQNPAALFYGNTYLQPPSANYFQINLTNVDAAGSACYTVTADDGTDTNNWMSMGINNSEYFDPQFPRERALPHDGYLTLAGGNLNISSVGNSIYFNTIDGALRTTELTNEGTWVFGANITLPTGGIVNTGHQWLFNSDGTTSFPAGYSLPNAVGAPGQVLVLNEDLTTSWQNQSGAGSNVDLNIWIEEFQTDTPLTDTAQIASSVEYDGEGNVYALMTIYSSSSDDYYAAVSKFGTYGVSQWHTRFQVGTSTDGWGMAIDTVGGYIYVAGRYNDGVYDKSTLTKLSTANGSVVWSTTYDFGSTSNSPVVDVDADGNPVIVGYANNGTNDQVTVVKISKTDGAVIWAQGLDGQGYEQAYGMAVGPSGEVVAIGYMDQLGEAGDTEDHMLVAKYDSAGNLQWQRAILFDVGYNCSGADADIDSMGNVYVCGQYQFDIGNGNTDTAMSLVKFDSNGAKQWSRRVVGNCQTLGTSVVVGPDDCLYLSGLTGNAGTEDFTWVVAKYNELGGVIWQRLLDNTAGWSFPGGLFFNNGGGSNIAVKDGYFVVGGGKSGLFGNDFRAAIAQFDAAGTPVVLGEWDFRPATFSGLLNLGATDITVVNAAKVSTDIGESITVATANPDIDTSNFLIGTVYNGNSSSTGDITFDGIQIQGALTTNQNGSIELVPNPDLKTNGQYLNIYPTNAFDYPHIHIAAGTGGDLFVGDDTTYFSVGNDGNLKINSNSKQWKFGTDGELTLPSNSVGDSVLFSAGNVELYSSNATASVSIRAKGDAGDNSWYFNNNGTLTLPNGANIVHGNVKLTLNENGYENAYLTTTTDDSTALFMTPVGVQLYANTDVAINAIHGELGLNAASGVYVSTNNKLWQFGIDGSTAFPDSTIKSPDSLTIQTSRGGIPSGVVSITSSSGMWESNPQTALPTTGGSGNGLTVDVSAGSGYVDAVSIVTTGTGYTDGDIITVTSGSSNAVFTISVPTNNWTFSTGGNIIMPDSGNLVTTTGSLHSISLDLLKSIVANSTTWGEFQANIAAL